MKNNRLALMVGLIAALCVGSSSAAEWGSLKGRFVVDGTPPKLTPLVINKDPEYCGQHNPVNETVVVGKNNALVNAVVYLRAPLGKKVDVNPEYEADLKKPAVLDNNGCAFKPHILMVRVGQQVVVKNSDPVGHNTNLTFLGFNPLVPAKTQTEITDSKASPLPTPVACNIHPWMKAYFLSLDHPYMAVSGDDGSFEIKSIPAGTNEFQFWHEAPGYLKNLHLKGGTTDARGRTKLTIKGGETLDLGDIKIAASGLAQR